MTHAQESKSNTKTSNGAEVKSVELSVCRGYCHYFNFTVCFCAGKTERLSKGLRETVQRELSFLEIPPGDWKPRELLGSFWGFGLSGDWLSTVSFQGHFLSSHVSSDLIFESTTHPQSKKCLFATDGLM